MKEREREREREREHLVKERQIDRQREDGGQQRIDIVVRNSVIKPLIFRAAQPRSNQRSAERTMSSPPPPPPPPFRCFVFLCRASVYLPRYFFFYLLLILLMIPF